MNIKVATVFSSLILLMLFVFSSNSSEDVDVHFLPGLHDKIYSQPGDINIGALARALDISPLNPAETCSHSTLPSSYAVESTEAVAFAVDFINRSPDILPNVTLGFVVGGICNSVGITLGTSFSFLPRTQRDYNGSIISNPMVGSVSSWSNNDVIGVVSPGYSSLTVPVSSLYAVGQLPVVGAIETSDELSNKVYHPYFFRIVPPDMYQVQAILKFISTNGWSYVSALYEDGSYGQKAFDGIQQHVDKYGICIATSHRLIHPPNYEHIVYDLLANHRARVVILYIYRESFTKMIQAVVDKNMTGHFIWVASDPLASYSGHDYDGVTEDPAIGAITFDAHTTRVMAFSEYLKQQKVSTSKNPWMKQAWEYLFDCSHDEETCDSSDIITKSPKFHAHTETNLRIDAVMTLAQAAHNLLFLRCPDAHGPEARKCITGTLLRKFLRNTSFDGFNGRVKFDDNQDVKGEYIISQLVQKYHVLPGTDVKVKMGIVRKTIGFYDVSTGTFTYFRENVSWSHLTSSDQFVNLTESMVSTQVPESKCSDPCSVGEYKIEKELPCCWECRKCRENEHLVKDNTTCETCPSFMWPDPASGFTSCEDIPLTYPMFKDPIPIVFTSLAIVALFATVSVIVSYIIYRDQRVIKASSRELSFIQLVAIFTGYTTIILFQTKPSDIMCGLIFFVFCMSFALLYSPLLVKTVRICRIFRSGNKNQKPRFISSRSQLVFASFLIAAQATLCVTVFIFYWPRAKRTQPIWSEKLVELSCDLTFPGIASFLGYNIVLVSLCSVFAFMVRKLPDNFNESKFISMCVTTTLLIWLAFIPTYFTSHRAFVRVFLLSAALSLNNTVALIFLFVPKIYAAKFLPPEAGDFSKNRS